MLRPSPNHEAQQLTDDDNDEYDDADDDDDGDDDDDDSDMYAHECKVFFI